MSAGFNLRNRWNVEWTDWGSEHAVKVGWRNWGSQIRVRPASHDPADCGTLAMDMASAGRQQWAAAEWWRGGGNPTEIRRRFEVSLNFKRCRFICVYNWRPFKGFPPNLAAVRKLIEKPR